MSIACKGSGWGHVEPEGGQCGVRREEAEPFLSRRFAQRARLRRGELSLPRRVSSPFPMSLSVRLLNVCGAFAHRTERAPGKALCARGLHAYAATDVRIEQNCARELQDQQEFPVRLAEAV